MINPITFKKSLEDWISDLHSNNQQNDFTDYWIDTFFNYVGEELSKSSINGSVAGTILSPFSAYVGSAINTSVSKPEDISSVKSFLKEEFMSMLKDGLSSIERNIKCANAICDAISQYLTLMASNTTIDIKGIGTNPTTGATSTINGNASITFTYIGLPIFKSTMGSLFSILMQNAEYNLGNSLFISTFITDIITFITSISVSIIGLENITGAIGTGTIT